LYSISAAASSASTTTTAPSTTVPPASTTGSEDHYQRERGIEKRGGSATHDPLVFLHDPNTLNTNDGHGAPHLGNVDPFAKIAP
jgi:hypothetical protein